MSLNKETCLHIAELSAAASENAGKDAEFPVAVLPGDMKIESLERYQVFRNQFRGVLNTDSIKDFTLYCTNQGVGDCFINRNNVTALAIFDIGTNETPGHCLHIARIELSRSIPYLTLLDKKDCRLEQVDFAEFLEDWRSEIKVMDSDGEPMEIAKAIGAVRKVTIEASSKSEHATQNYSAETSSMDTMDASSGGKNLPGYLDFTCKPYEGLKEYGFSLRISLIVTGDKPLFILRPIKFDAVHDEISEEFKKLITDGLNNKLNTYMGSFNPNP